MTTMPPSAMLPFNRVCNCRGISRQNILDAVAAGPHEDGKALYAAALENRQRDVDDGKAGFITGAERGKSYKCGKCSSIFDEVVSTAKHRTIQIVSSTPTAPRIGSCGNDCNTCTTTVPASGCAI